MQIKDNNAFLMAMGSGSRIEIHAQDAQKTSFTELTATVNAGAISIELAEAKGWEVGDRIAIASSDYDSDQAETARIVAISADGRKLTLDQPLQFMHYGQSETISNGLSGAQAQNWQINESAEVALLSRNVEISGDADSTQDGFGGHMMVMGGAEMHISGAEFDMMGQSGILGRYPAHWHMLGDAGAGQYIENSSFHHSYHKAITIHGTHDSRVEGNVVFNTQGHGIFLEDGSETGNLIKSNIVFGQKAVASEDAVITSDAENVSSYWITNPNNDLIDNVAAGSDKGGFWYAIGKDFTGLSKTSAQFEGDAAPYQAKIGLFEGNEAHSNVAGLFKTTNPDEDNPGRIVINGQGLIADGFASFRNQEWSANLDKLVGDVDFINSVIGAAGDGLLFNSDVSVVGSLIYGETENVGNPDTPGEHNAGKSFADDRGKDAGTAEGLAFYSGRFDLDDSHFAKFDDPKHNILAVGKGAGTEDFVGRITSDATVDGTDLAFLPQEAGAGRQGHAIFDEFGELSGVPGAYLTSAWFSSHASAGAYEHPDFKGYVITDARIAELFEDGQTGNVGPDRITRYDAIDGPRTDGDPGTATRTQLVMLGDGNDYVYAYDFGARALEDDQNGITLVGAFDKEYVFIEAANASAKHHVPGALHVGSLDQLKVAPSKAYFYDDGKLYVKLFGGDARGKSADDPNRLEFELGAQPQAITTVPEVAYSPLKYSAEQIKAFLPDTSRPDLPRAEDRRSHDLDGKAQATSDTIDPASVTSRWSDDQTWAGSAPVQDSMVVINDEDAVLLDESVSVRGIIINGGALVVEDVQALALSADWVLVINEGLFQVGTPDNPHVNDFKLILEGDDPSQDLNIPAILAGQEGNTIFSDTNWDLNLADPNHTPTPGPILVAAVNAGGTEFTAQNGLVYAADPLGAGGTFRTNADISGTTNDGLYQSERWQKDAFVYETPVANGIYDVELNFAEIWSGAQTAGKRQFDILIEDKLVFKDLDIADEVGFNAALTLVGQVEVTDGSLSISTDASLQNPKIAGFSIWQAQTPTEIEWMDSFQIGNISDGFEFL